MATLLLTLPRTGLQAGTAVDYVLSPDGVRVASASSAAPALLPGANGSGTSNLGRITEVVLMVGAAQISWHQVQLPKGVGSARLRAVLEGLLEDQLLDEPAALHFAVAPGAAKAATAWVAVCNKSHLQQSVQALEAAGLTVARIVPELVPPTGDGKGTLCAVENAGQPLLLQADGKGVQPWPLLPGTVSLLNLPQELPLTAEPAVAALAEQLFGRSVTLQSRAERALAACQTDWDLAQLDLVSNQRSRSLKRLGNAWQTLLHAPRWRAVRWGLVALLAVNILGLNVRAAVERADLKAQRKAIEAVLTTTFPATQLVVDAPVQMERAVAALQQSTGALGARDFETLLGAWAQAAPDAPAPSGIDFANGELQLHGLTLSATSLAQATGTLKTQGLVLKATGSDLILKGE
jgi:general secretion pathway protein L